MSSDGRASNPPCGVDNRVMDPETLSAVREAVMDLRRQAKAPPNGDLADLVAARVGALDDVLSEIDELEVLE